jgi:hypothetical protein
MYIGTYYVHACNANKTPPELNEGYITRVELFIDFQNSDL